MRFRQTGLIVAATLVVFAPQMQAAPVYRAEVYEYPNGGQAVLLGSSPVDTQEVSGVPSTANGNGSYTGRAAADRGLLRTRISVSVPAQFQSDIGARFLSVAEFYLDDLLITGPGGGPTTVSATMRARVDGEFFAAGEGSGHISLLRLNMYDVISNGLVSAEGNYIPGVGGTGLLAGQSGNAIHDTVSMTSNLSTTYANTVGVRFIVVADTAKWWGGSATTDFFDTVHFASDGPVFNLPEGYTANSVSGNIVDNHWVNPVPEPSSFLLGSIAAAGMVAVAIRRKRRRATNVSQPC